VSAQALRSYEQDPELLGRVLALADTAFPGIMARALRIRLPGGHWRDRSVPFVVERERELVAHVGVLSLEMVVAGERCRVGGIHAVCTHPAERGRGHFRALMEEALAWCESRFPTLLLFTDWPSLYEPFGFRSVGEHRFRASVRSAGGARASRTLDLTRPRDLATLERLLETRAPVSDVLGVVAEKAVFTFHCPERGLVHAPELPAIVWMELRGTTLTLHDVVAPRIPGLAEILDLIPAPVTEVEIAFAPDRLGVDAAAVAAAPELMARGPFAAENARFAVPPSARF